MGTNDKTQQATGSQPEDRFWNAILIFLLSCAAVFLFIALVFHFSNFVEQSAPQGFNPNNWAGLLASGEPISTILASLAGALAVPIGIFRFTAWNRQARQQELQQLKNDLKEEMKLMFDSAGEIQSAKFDSVNLRLDGMDARFDRMDTRQDRMDDKLDRIESQTKEQFDKANALNKEQFDSSSTKPTH